MTAAPGITAYGAAVELLQLQQKFAQASARLSQIADDDVEIASTPKDEVFRIDKTVLYRYAPLVEKPAPVPILLVYALVGRYTMLDLQDDRSFVRHLLKSGMDVYVVDWGHPTRVDRYAGLNDYVNDYLTACIDEMCRRHEVDGINLLGICQGGVLTLCYTALHQPTVRNLITTVTPVDFHADLKDERVERGFMNVWTRSLSGQDIDRLVDTLGTVPGEFMGYLFSLMTPGRSLTKYNLDLLDAAGDDAKLLNFLRMEKWLADRPDQPGEAARQWLKELYQENKLIKNQFVLDGRTVDLRNISCPVLNIYTETDHIIPPDMSRALQGAVGASDYTELVIKGGHIGIFVSTRSHVQLGDSIVDWLASR